LDTAEELNGGTVDVTFAVQHWKMHFFVCEDFAWSTAGMASFSRFAAWAGRVKTFLADTAVLVWCIQTGGISVGNQGLTEGVGDIRND